MHQIKASATYKCVICIVRLNLDQGLSDNRNVVFDCRLGYQNTQLLPAPTWYWSSARLHIFWADLLISSDIELQALSHFLHNSVPRGACPTTRLRERAFQQPISGFRLTQTTHFLPFAFQNNSGALSLERLAKHCLAAAQSQGTANASC